MCRYLRKEGEGTNTYILFCIEVALEGKDVFNKIAQVSLSCKTNFDFFGCFP